MNCTQHHTNTHYELYTHYSVVGIRGRCLHFEVNKTVQDGGCIQHREKRRSRLLHSQDPHKGPLHMGCNIGGTSTPTQSPLVLPHLAMELSNPPSQAHIFSSNSVHALVLAVVLAPPTQHAQGKRKRAVISHTEVHTGTEVM